MSLSKKHFEWAAEYLARNGGIEQCPGHYEAFTDLFLRFGPRFDMERFRAKIKALIQQQKEGK